MYKRDVQMYFTYPLFLGWADAMAERGAKKLGHIQFDAHFDLAAQNVVLGTHYNGSPVRRIAELEMVDPRNIALIGVRGYTRAEQYEFAQKNGVAIFNMKHVRELGIIEVTRRALEAASKGCDAVYLTVDIDAVDCAFAPGNGTHAFGGITSMELIEAMQVLSGADIIKAFDLCEVCPLHDPTGMTPDLAANAILEFLDKRALDTD